jgi:ferredoxin--NADP+ reductase
LVLRAVGYHGVTINGLPFDERRGVIPNDRSRVTESEREYVVGWIKRGPTGIIGTNKKDSVETVTRLLEDLDNGSLRRHDRDGAPSTSRPGWPTASHTWSPRRAGS